LIVVDMASRFTYAKIAMKTHFALAAFLLAGSITLTRPALADVPPMCSDFDTYMPCSKDDVGKSCSNGGTCRTINCGNASSASIVYRCTACPPLIAGDNDGGSDAGMECTSFTDIGKPCGAAHAGTCSRPPSYCNLGALACIGSVPVLPPWDGGTATDSGAGQDAPAEGSMDATAPPPEDAGAQPPPDAGGAPATGDSGGCNCGIAAYALQPFYALLSPLLLAIGTAALIFDRRRRRNR
jgi:hypothetical protein